MFPFTCEQFNLYRSGQHETLEPATVRAIASNYEAAFRSMDPLVVAVQSFLTPQHQPQSAPIHIVRQIPPEPKQNQPETKLKPDVVLALLRSVPMGQVVSDEVVACINQNKLAAIDVLTKQQAHSQVGNRPPSSRTDLCTRLNTAFRKNVMGIMVLKNPRAPDLPPRMRRFPYQIYKKYMKDPNNSECINAIAAAYDAVDLEFDTPEVDADIVRLKLTPGKHLHDELWQYDDRAKHLVDFATGCDCGMPNRLFVLDPETQKMILKTF